MVDVTPKSHFVLLVIKVLICDCVTKDIVEDLVEWNKFVGVERLNMQRGITKFHRRGNPDYCS